MMNRLIIPVQIELFSVRIIQGSEGTGVWMTVACHIYEPHIIQSMAITMNSLRTPEKKSCIEYADSPNDA